MQLTAKFTNVYDGEEDVRTETIDVAPASNPCCEDSIREWSDEELFPYTGSGRDSRAQAGYFAEIVDCEEQPNLVGREFDWL